MIYLDSSSLLKLLWDEPESGPTRAAIAAEPEVVISSLTELETEVQLKAAWLAGRYRERVWRGYQRLLSELLGQTPFHYRTLPAAVFQTALRQHRATAADHCRTLDRLHIAAMEELDINRLMTHDHRQAEAARAMNYEVLSPAITR